LFLMNACPPAATAIPAREFPFQPAGDICVLPVPVVSDSKSPLVKPIVPQRFDCVGDGVGVMDPVTEMVGERDGVMLPVGESDTERVALPDGVSEMVAVAVGVTPDGLGVVDTEMVVLAVGDSVGVLEGVVVTVGVTVTVPVPEGVSVAVAVAVVVGQAMATMLTASRSVTWVFTVPVSEKQSVTDDAPGVKLTFVTAVYVAVVLATAEKSGVALLAPASVTLRRIVPPDPPVTVLPR